MIVKENPASMERWFFYQDAVSLWKWARLDLFGTVLGCSDSAFEAHEESFADAHRNGYHEGSLVSEATSSSAVRRFPGIDLAATHTDRSAGGESLEAPSSGYQR